MYLLTKGKIINPDSGIVIAKAGAWSSNEDEKFAQIISYPIHNSKDITVLRHYDSTAQRDKVFNDLLNFLSKMDKVFQL